MENLVNHALTIAGSASILFVAVTAVSAISTRFADDFCKRGVLLGLMFAGVGAIVMHNSIELVEGIRTDPRSAVVAISAGFGGPLSGAVTGVTLILIRIYYGGAGVPAGVGMIAAVTVTSIALWTLWRMRRLQVNWLFVTLLAGITAVIPPIVVLLVSQAALSVQLTSIALFIPANIASVLLVSIALFRDRERQQAIAARQEAEAQLQGIASNAPDILFQLAIHAGQPHFTYSSAASSRILMVAPEELVEDFSIIGRGLQLGKLQDLLSQITQSARSGEPWSAEAEYVRPDGQIVWLRFRAEPRTDAAGHLLWDGTISDVTDQKRSEKMKEDFVSIISHELRTPLTSIRGSLGLIQSGAGGEVPAKAGRMLDIASRNSERLIMLVNDLLDMQKIHSGQMRLALKPEPLRPILEQAISACRDYMPEKEIRFVLRDDAPCATANIDTNRFHQILANLFSNAQKFSPARSLVTISVMHREGAVRISVSDQGPGIPEEFRKRIFQKFEQAEEAATRKAGGTGLGLNITRALVEAMGGTINFETGDGAGTTFYVDFPLHNQNAVDHGQDFLPDKGRILICAVDSDLSMAVAQDLAKAGLRSDLVPDAECATELLAERDYAAIMVDGRAIDCRDVFSRVRGKDPIFALPIIVLAAEPAKDGSSLCGSATEVLDWLQLPLDQDRLRTLLSKRLANEAADRPSILYVEDDPAMHEVMRQAFRYQASLTCAITLAEARECLAEADFDAFLLDQVLPDGSGLDLLPDLPEGAPVVLFSAFDVASDTASRVAGVLTKSVSSEVNVAQTVLAALSPSKKSIATIQISA